VSVVFEGVLNFLCVSSQKMVEVLCTVFGLRHVRKTQVGNNAIRGVSGGEKKRVSIAEALATRMRVGSWDKFVISW
jgi:ATP-binding cassette subfamily G (WHITE) protein 2 (SNQ2)